MKIRIICQTLGLVALAIMASGCAATVSASDVYWSRVFDRVRNQSAGTGQTAADRLHTVRQAADQDARSIVDDIDYIFMWDRPSRLSRWHNR